MVAELLKDVFIVKKLINRAIRLRKQVLDGLTALRPVVLPEVRVKEPIEVLMG